MSSREGVKDTNFSGREGRKEYLEGGRDVMKSRKLNKSRREGMSAEQQAEWEANRNVEFNDAFSDNDEDEQTPTLSNFSVVVPTVPSYANPTASSTRRAVPGSSPPATSNPGVTVVRTQKTSNLAPTTVYGPSGNTNLQGWSLTVPNIPASAATTTTTTTTSSSAPSAPLRTTRSSGPAPAPVPLGGKKKKVIPKPNFLTRIDKTALSEKEKGTGDRHDWKEPPAQANQANQAGQAGQGTQAAAAGGGIKATKDKVLLEIQQRAELLYAQMENVAQQKGISPPYKSIEQFLREPWSAEFLKYTNNNNQAPEYLFFKTDYKKLKLNDRLDRVGSQEAQRFNAIKARYRQTTAYTRYVGLLQKNQEVSSAYRKYIKLATNKSEKNKYGRRFIAALDTAKREAQQKIDIEKRAGPGNTLNVKALEGLVELLQFRIENVERQIGSIQSHSISKDRSTTTQKTLEKQQDSEIIKSLEKLEKMKTDYEPMNSFGHLLASLKKTANNTKVPSFPWVKNWRYNGTFFLVDFAEIDPNTAQIRLKAPSQVTKNIQWDDTSNPVQIAAQQYWGTMGPRGSQTYLIGEESTRNRYNGIIQNPAQEAKPFFESTKCLFYAPMEYVARKFVAPTNRTYYYEDTPNWNNNNIVFRNNTASSQALRAVYQHHGSPADWCLDTTSLGLGNLKTLFGGSGKNVQIADFANNRELF